MIPIPYRYAALAASLAACYGIGYTQARHHYKVQLEMVNAVAAATDARYRQLEKEAAHAQSAFVQSWTASRDAARADWVRLKATSAGRVPVVCAESGGAGADQRDGVEAASGQGDRDLLPAVVNALEQGERLEATLALCQRELRQCAGMR